MAHILRSRGGLSSAESFAFVQRRGRRLANERSSLQSEVGPWFHVTAYPKTSPSVSAPSILSLPKLTKASCGMEENPKLALDLNSPVDLLVAFKITHILP